MLLLPLDNTSRYVYMLFNNITHTHTYIYIYILHRYLDVQSERSVTAMESQARSTASPLAPKKPCFSCRQLVKGSALRRLFSSLQFDAVLQSSDDHHSCCWPTCASSVPTTLRAKLVAADLDSRFWAVGVQGIIMVS